MTGKILTVLATAGVAALGVTGVGYAQRTEARADTTTPMRAMHDMAGMPAMMNMMGNCPMMQAMGGPAAALQHRDSLGLSDTQVQRLEAIRARSGETRDRMMERMRALHSEIAGVSAADRFDEAAVRRAFTQMGEAHADMGVARLRARHETRETLTPEQRETLAGLGGGMMGMQGMQGMSGMMEMMGGDMGGMMGMMEHCPMMQGMMQGGMEGMRMQHRDSMPMSRENQV